MIGSINDQRKFQVTSWIQQATTGRNLSQIQWKKTLHTHYIQLEEERNDECILWILLRIKFHSP